MATFERAENGTWVVALVEEPNVHGYGDTLLEARRNIRDAIVTLFGPFGADADGFELAEDIRLPVEVRAMIDRARVERKRVSQRREHASAAEDAAGRATSEALVATRQAAGLLLEHAELVRAEADRASLMADVRPPELVLRAVDRAQVARQAACGQGEAAKAAEEAAKVTMREAIVTNREAARMLTQKCGLSGNEAAGLLGLSPERVRRLLTD